MIKIFCEPQLWVQESRGLLSRDIHCSPWCIKEREMNQWVKYRCYPDCLFQVLHYRMCYPNVWLAEDSLNKHSHLSTVTSYTYAVMTIKTQLLHWAMVISIVMIVKRHVGIDYTSTSHYIPVHEQLFRAKEHLLQLYLGQEGVWCLRPAGSARTSQTIGLGGSNMLRYARRVNLFLQVI